MADKRFAKNVSIILGIGGVLVLFSFVLVAHHREIPDRVRQNRNALLGAGSSASVSPRASTPSTPTPSTGYRGKRE